jgi:predicted transcriptional regulator
MARKRTPGPTDRELAILSVLWERGPSTVREVHEALHQDDEDETGYTTTLKLMQIMVEKGSLVREEDDGRRRVAGVPPAGRRRDAFDTNARRHIYRPALSEERTQKQLVQNLLDRVFAGSAEKLVLRALSARKVSPNELKRIRKMIEEMEEA